MRAAYYEGTALTGSGQNIGLLEYAGFDIADVNTYYKNAGQTRTAAVTGISTDGTSLSCLYKNACDDTEQTIDITQALGMAPGVTTVYMYVGSTDTALLGAMSSDQPLPLNLSSSWLWSASDSSTDDPYFEKMASQGQTFFQAAGDSGAWKSGDYTWPADSAYLTAVGGTDLTTQGAGGAWSSETVWVDGGGGYYAPDDILIPSWQQLSGVINSANEGSTTYRNAPDVSANANFTFYVCADQTTCTENYYGGTSFAAPMWAGYIALTNQQAASNGGAAPGFLNPTIYPLALGSGYGNDFHDITSGSNGFPAVLGYDLASGWGSPNQSGLINALNNNPGATTTALASSANPSAYDESVTFTATVTSGKGTPTGTVSFYDGTTLLGTGTLNSGTATYTTSSLSVGSQSITAVYGGNLDFNGSTSPVLNQVVNKASTTVGLTSSQNPSNYGQAVTFTATVTGLYGGTATGEIAFYDGATMLGVAALSDGVAAYTTTGLGVGSNSITAAYSGDGNFTGSTSPALNQTVNQTSGQLVNQATGDYWPLAQGNTWVYANETNDPGASTTITVLNNPTSWGCSGNAPAPNNAVEVEIIKHDTNTYFYPGNPWTLHWMLGNDPLGNLMPWGWWIWNYSQGKDAGASADVQSQTPGFPAFLILPATVSENQDASMIGEANPVTTPPYPAPCVTGTGGTESWQASWSSATVNTNAYSGSAIQSFVNGGQGGAEEQWYYAKQVGPVQIYEDTIGGAPYLTPDPPFPPRMQLQSYSVVGLYGNAAAIAPTNASYLVAPVSTQVNYEWFANFVPTGQLNGYSAYYTVNSADDCGNVPNNNYTWTTINSPSGTAQTPIATCQGTYNGVPTGHTYSYNYVVMDNSENKYQAVLTVVVPPYGTPGASLTANGGTSISVNVGDNINFKWSDTSGLGTSASSYFYVDKTDNCGSAGYPTQNNWIANTTNGSFQATAAACQAGRTYTISYVVDNGTYQSTSAITVYVNPGVPAAQLAVNDLTNNQSCNTNNCLITVNVGDTISYQWQVVPPAADGFWTLSSFTVGPTGDGCGNSTGVTYPWVAYSYSGVQQGQIASCQAGSTYTITYEVSGQNGILASSTVQLQVE
jgi:hypothetical protein